MRKRAKSPPNKWTKKPVRKLKSVLVYPLNKLYLHSKKFLRNNFIIIKKVIHNMKNFKVLYEEQLGSYTIYL